MPVVLVVVMSVTARSHEAREAAEVASEQLDQIDLVHVPGRIDSMCSSAILLYNWWHDVDWCSAGAPLTWTAVQLGGRCASFLLYWWSANTHESTLTYKLRLSLNLCR
jgi:hypothetical protein